MHPNPSIGGDFALHQGLGEVIEGHRLDRLERRITKLSALLGKTEQQLAQAREGDEDLGLASFFSDAGLAEGDVQFEQKRSLLSAIFDANHKLQVEPDE